MCITSRMKPERKFIKKQFDLDFLHTLIEDEGSCVELHTLKQHLALHPYHLNDIHGSVKELLNMGLSKYSAELDGILFGYKNVKFVTEAGLICYDSFYIHVDIEADFFIFKPVVGKVLQGVVNKKSVDHVACLVHKLFNVSLLRGDSGKHWKGDSLDLGNEVSFQVIQTDFTGRLPYIKGKILSLVSEGDISSNTKITFDEEEDEEKKKKHKKDKSLEQEESFSQLVEDAPDELPTKKHKKSKKHKKDKIKIKQEKTSDDEISLPELDLKSFFSTSDVDSKPGIRSSFSQMVDSDKVISKKRKLSVSFNSEVDLKYFNSLPGDSDLENLIGRDEKKKKKLKKRKERDDEEDEIVQKKKIKKEVD